MERWPLSGPKPDLTADDIGFNALSGCALDDGRTVVSMLCEQAGVFRLTADSIIEDIIHAVETLNELMATAKLDGPRRETARVRTLQHCRQAGIKDARTLIDSVLKQKPIEKAKTNDTAPISLADDEPASEPVDGAMVLDETSALIRRHVVLSASQADAVALWTGAAHAIDGLDRMAMLLFTSPSPECGKTTAETVMSGIVPRPLIVSSLTPAVLFRLIHAHHPTLIADEVDSWLTDEKSELRGIFNAAHWRAGAVIPRCVGDTHKIELFNVFGPKLIAMIGQPKPTMLSRCIVVKLQRKTARDRVERVREDRVRNDHAPLRRQWRRWALDHLDALRCHEPEMPAGLPENRASDNWRPLISIADLAGGDWPARARQAALALSGVRMTEDEPVNVALLSDVQAVFVELGESYLSSDDIISTLRAMQDRPWADWNKGRGISPSQLASRLRDFGDGPLRLTTRNTRTGPGPKDVAKRWHRSDFSDAWARYVPSEPLHPLHANESGHEPVISEPLQRADVAACENAIPPTNLDCVAGVASSQPDLQVSEETEASDGRF